MSRDRMHAQGAGASHSRRALAAAIGIALLSALSREAHCQFTLPAGWQQYDNRYAIVIESNVGHPCFFGTCNKMREVLINDYGFKPENVRFYAPQSELDAHKDVVYATSVHANLVAGYQWAKSVCTPNDLFYTYLVDHGNAGGFSIPDGTLDHSELGTLLKSINAKIVIGAYNPCMSGCLIDDASEEGVITITSTACNINNSFSWAENWWASIMSHPNGQEYVSSCPTTMSSTTVIADANGDGIVSMFEGYLWTAKIAEKNGAKGERTSIDANGDGVSSEYYAGSADPTKTGSDAYIADHYSLAGWLPLSGATVATSEHGFPSQQIDVSNQAGRTLSWSMERSARVTVHVYAPDGSLVSTPVNEESFCPGRHSVSSAAGAGVHLIEMRLNGTIAVAHAVAF